jgi:hypothetical protein
MKFTAATVIAIIGMSNALPAPHYGTDATPSATQYGNYETSLPVTTSSCASDGVQLATSTVPLQSGQGTEPTAPASGGDLTVGGGLDLGGLLGGLLGGGLDIGVGGGLNLEGVLGGLTGLLEGEGHLDGSGHLDIGGLLDGLKGTLGGLYGGAEIGLFCDQLKVALSGSGNIDLGILVPGLEALLSGSGKLDLGAALGIDVDGLIDGLKLLLNASVKGSGGLDIDVLLGQLEGFLAGYGNLDLGAGVGLELSGVMAQLKGLLSLSGSVSLDISSVLDALSGLLSGSVDFNGFIAASIKLSGGELLVSSCGQLTTILIGLGIDFNAIVGQLISVLGGFLEGSLDISGSLLANAVLDLSGLLVAVGNLSGRLNVGGQVGAGVSVGGSIVGKVGGLLGGLLRIDASGKNKLSGGLKLGGW